MSHCISASHISFEFVFPQDRLCYMPYIAGMASRLCMNQWNGEQQRVSFRQISNARNWQPRLCIANDTWMTLYVYHKRAFSKINYCKRIGMPDFTLDAGLLARSQYPGGPATGHLDTDFSWFPCVYKRMLRWFPSFHVATTCFSCSPPDWNFLVTFFSIFVYM